MNYAHYYHTLRYLRLSQLVAQARNRLRMKLETPSSLSTKPAPELPACIWKPPGAFLPPGGEKNCADNIIRGQFTFLNQERAIGWMPQWDIPNLSKLWLYNLHYFEWIWSFDRNGETQDFEKAKSVVLDWINKCELSPRQAGWEPYPVSLRLMNWCAFFFGVYREQTLNDVAFEKRLWGSIWIQAERLATHLEYHLRGNHLLENAAALALTGACFADASAKRWFAIGSNLLEKQIKEQILPDGLHFERSPMYHSRMVFLFLLLYNTGNKKLQQSVLSALQEMLKALAVLNHPDKKIALLNDSAFGIYNEPDVLINYATMTGIIEHNNASTSQGCWSLPVAGYYGYRGNDGTYVVCDAGPIGPDYIPGHAHADIFSFELSIKGCRVIVDSGVYDYEKGAMRSYCRSTRAHNTVEIEGQDQSEMWDVFRVARRAYPHEIKWTPTSDGFQLSGWHDGYRRLDGNPLHHRIFTYHKSGALTVLDSVKSKKPVKCKTTIHLHPDCTCKLLDKRTVLINYPAGVLRVAYNGNGLLELLEGFYCPEFNMKQKNGCLTFAWLSSESAEVKYTIEIQS